MTKFQKQMLTIAAAGALTAVTALPAMAFENEFHGMFAIKTFLSNFDNGASGVIPGAKDTKTNNYTDQRTRIQYTAKASDDLKLVTHFEMNTRWGVAYSASAAGEPATAGGDIDTDGANFLVKHAYLDFNVGKPLNVKLGQMAYKDTLKGLYVDADLPMAYVTYKAGGYTMGLGYSRFNDAASALTAKSYLGDKASDLFVLDNTYAISKDTKVGMSYYLNVDNQLDVDGPLGKDKKVHTLGLFGETKFGALALSGFAAMQAGSQKNFVGNTTQNYHGWAADVLATMKVGSGTARTGFMFTSGDNGNGTDVAHNRGWQTVSYLGTNATAAQNSYNESGMMLLVRNTAMGGTSTDGYFRKPITNIALAHMGYDATLTEKLYLNGNVGFAWIPASGRLATPSATAQTAVFNGSDFMGTEINVETGYKLYKNLTLKAQVAYVMLGGAYKNLAAATPNNDPANPYTMRLGAHYSF
jgi:hypothetical protein